MRVLLASASPRRRELMKEIFSGFDVRAFPCDEKKLSGRTHTVYSGVSVLKEGRLLRKVARSEVKFRDLTKKEISDYVSAHSVLDKAGAYAIQDGVVVEKYEGSYSNIVGLPFELLREMI